MAHFADDVDEVIRQSQSYLQSGTESEGLEGFQLHAIDADIPSPAHRIRPACTILVENKVIKEMEGFLSDEFSLFWCCHSALWRRRGGCQGRLLWRITAMDPISMLLAYQLREEK